MSVSKNFINDIWDVDCYVQYISLPTTDYAASFIRARCRRTWEFEVDIREELIGEKIAVYEDQHPQLKGTMTEWEVLRVEIYHGDDDCAYKQFVVCHCDRVSETLSPKLAEEVERDRVSLEAQKPIEIIKGA